MDDIPRFDDVRSEGATPARQRSSRQDTLPTREVKSLAWYGCGGCFVVLFLAVFIVSIGLNVWFYFDGGGFPSPSPSPIVEPEDNETDSSTNDYSPKGSTLVVVSESKDRPAAEVMALDVYTFWREYLPSIGVKWYLLDPDDSDAKSYLDYAAKKNIKPPFAVHEHSGRARWIESFPPNKNEPTDLTRFKELLNK